MPPGLKALAAVPEEPIPLSVLTGFLGSGKTTFLGRVLASPDLADTAVVINEFGAVALDHLLLEAESEGIVDLPNGCICCAVRQDLADTLYRLVDRRRDSGRPPFRRIALETSGLADPAPILYTLSADAYLEASLRLDRIVTTIDTIAGPATLDALSRGHGAGGQRRPAGAHQDRPGAGVARAAGAARGAQPDRARGRRCGDRCARRLCSAARRSPCRGRGLRAEAVHAHGITSLCRAPAAADDPARVRHGAGAAGAGARREPAAREGPCGVRRSATDGRPRSMPCSTRCIRRAGWRTGRTATRRSRLVFIVRDHRAGDDPGPFRAPGDPVTIDTIDEEGEA